MASLRRFMSRTQRAGSARAASTRNIATNGWEEGMTPKTIEKAQKCLIVEGLKILDIEPLLRTHSKEAVVWFLKTMSKEKKKLVMNLIITDTTDSGIDEAIAMWFRLNMAIQALNEDKEVN